MAKSIQRLPENAPDPMILPAIGWKELHVHIDYLKLMFLYRILALLPNNLYRIVFLRRMYYILLNGVYCCLSPVAQIIKAMQKYDILEYVIKAIDEDNIPSKSIWKKLVLSRLNEYFMRTWRFQLTMYSKLNIYRNVCITATHICWWELNMYHLLNYHA